MKVVFFCGGMGMRLKDYDEHIPKPMVTVGHRPIVRRL
jgi:glucose-1-phosphate cytidylyltransferase